MTDLHTTVDDQPVLRTVGRYQILREVGRGGTAVVYLARQTDLGRYVALKELAAFHAAKPEVVARFLRESRLTGSLNHPNVVTVHEYLEHDGVAYIAMEYFERGSLRPWVGRLTPPQIAGVLDGVLAGLAHAESRGVVHRDLKPENVMVTADGGVKIADFGIAKALQARAGQTLTASGTTVGTPAYMAPEQALGQGVGPWTDLYAAGVVAYELLAGTVPFPEDEMPLATLLRHVNEPVPSLRSRAPHVDPALVAWVERMLRKTPEERPRSAADARDQLEEAILAALGPRWRRDARLPDGAAAAAEAPTLTRIDGSSAPTADVRRASRRARLAWIAALLAAAGIAAAAVAVLVRDDEATPQSPRPRALVPDYVPSPRERLSMAVAGPYVVVADPRGRLAQVDPATLTTVRVVRDPAGPVGPAVRSGHVYVADGETLTARRAGTLAPVDAVSLRGAVAVASTRGGPLAVASRLGEDEGRVCALRRLDRPGTCAELPFSPTGVGVAASGTPVAVADGDGGRVTLLRRSGRGLAATASVAVGSGPRGELRFFRGRLYVPIERGIAVVDTTSRRVRVVRLPVSPSSLWISPRGRLYAALPARGKLAVLETAEPARAPTFVSVGRRPTAVTGMGDAVFATAADRRIVRFDGPAGRQTGSARLRAVGAPVPRPTVLRRVTARRNGRTVTVTLALAGVGLDASGLVVRDPRIADGEASLELWQGAIRTRTRRARLGGLTVRITRVPGRLAVRIGAARGSFTALRVRRRAGHSVLLELTARPRSTAPRPRATAPPPPPSSASPTAPAVPTPPASPPPADDCCVTG